MPSKAIKFGLLALLGAAFLWGIVSIFSVRFSSGNLYPEYSSRRSDPMGSKALFGTLDALGIGAVSRVEDPSAFRSYPASGEDLFFVIGPNPIERQPESDSLWTALAEKLEQGARVAIAMRSEPILDADLYEQLDGFQRRKPKDDPEDAEENSEDAWIEESISLKQWLHELDLEFLVLRDKLSVPGARAYQESGYLAAEPQLPTLDSSIVTRSLVSLAFEEASEWQALYQVETFPVAARRQVGSGELIVFSNPYPFSNEALYRHRPAELLAWLLRDDPQVHFLELQLGVLRQQGIVGLARRQGFGPALALVFAAAVLFVWSSSFSPAPKRRVPRQIDIVTGLQGSPIGFRHLLRDGVPIDQIGPIAFQTWRRDQGARRYGKARADAAEHRFESFNATTRDARETVSFFRDMAQILKR